MCDAGSDLHDTSRAASRPNRPQAGGQRRVQRSGSSVRAISAPRGTLAISGGILGCHKLKESGEGVVIGIQWIKAK